MTCKLASNVTKSTQIDLKLTPRPETGDLKKRADKN
jgi:hypothetical protein